MTCLDFWTTTVSKISLTIGKCGCMPTFLTFLASSPSLPSMHDHGFVYSIGEVYYPSPSACPCTCTEDGPVCIRPKCPRIHPRCTRIKYKSCCPVCEAVSKVCVYGVSNLLFQLSRCERCRCEPNREVYCSISDCPAPHCVNPTYEPNHCCPVCYTGEFTSTNTLLSNTINAWSYVTQAFRCTCCNICLTVYATNKR
uniref:Si:dkey-283b1.7 n=1 Tax=Hucho hucho TaxID=62062 RepID=A0A4W5MEQ1_9TELE